MTADPVHAPVTRFADVGSVTLAYETFGDPAGEPLVLVMGLATQMIAWPDPLCRALADLGHHVIRFDNRDIGLSTHLDGLPTPKPWDTLLPHRRPPYSLDDMADDTVGLLDALGLESAHLVGASLGGFIAQTVAVRHPDRVRSLSLVMTSTGSRRVGLPSPRAALVLLRRPPTPDREAAIQMRIDTFRVIGSPGYPLDETYVRDLAGRSYDRAFDPAGVTRQLAAAMSQPDRTRALAGVRVPTVVMHGLDDPLIHPSGGRALAQAIPGARFVGFPGMGHDLPAALWPQYVDEIASVTGRGH
ncbi:MAG: alpha/beta fold hydrolase [Candidatus Nanopelagicales bacterium]